MAEKEKKVHCGETVEEAAPTETQEPEIISEAEIVVEQANDIEKEEAEKAEESDLSRKFVELNDKYLRLYAEFDNFKKRAQRERVGIYADACAAVISAILPCVDALELAALTPCRDDVYKKGVELTLSSLKAAFEKIRVVEINPQNEPFDPKLHEAVMTTEDSTLPENTVCEVLQKGYSVDGLVIRHAMVKVANA